MLMHNLFNTYCIYICNISLCKVIIVLSRLNQEIKGGAWCPKSQITTESTEWLEVNLHSVHVITGTGTQGRFGNGQGQEYAEAYVLEYWRPKLAKWVRYRGADGQEVINIYY